VKGSFTAPASTLASAIKYAARWIDSKPATPIYGGMLFTAADERLTVAGMSENAAASAATPVEGDADGSFVVAGRLVDQLVGTFPNRPVTFEQDGAVVAIAVGSGRWTLPCMPENDYPTLPQQALLAGMVDGAALADAVHRIAACASRDTETRVALAGLHLSFDEDSALQGIKADGGGHTPYTLTLTAIDGHRTSRQSIAWEPDPEGAVADIFGESALVFAHVISDAVDAFVGIDPVAIGYEVKGQGAGVFSLTTPARSLVMRTIGADFPDTSGMFAVTGAESATVRPADMVLPLKRAVMLDNREWPQVIAKFSEDLLTLSAGSDEIDQRGAEEIAGVSYGGAECSFVLRAGLFGAAMSSVPGDTAVISFQPGTTRPIVITSPADPTWRHILMPLRKAGS
jgi:DNA polymerase-3 subunit beta